MLIQSLMENLYRCKHKSSTCDVPWRSFAVFRRDPEARESVQTCRWGRYHPVEILPLHHSCKITAQYAWKTCICYHSYNATMNKLHKHNTTAILRANLVICLPFSFCVSSRHENALTPKLFVPFSCLSLAKCTMSLSKSIYQSEWVIWQQ